MWTWTTEGEIEGYYVWAETKEAPVKADDHGPDALRCMVAHLDLKPKRDRERPTSASFGLFG